MMKFYLILMLTIQGQQVPHPYEFDNYQDCKEAVLDLRAAYKGQKNVPPVFCSPSATPFNPGAPRAVELAAPLDLTNRGTM